ncbi:MAG: hypothetical protein AMXMBFR46_10320 [Acidimicrobiia bacterium]
MDPRRSLAPTVALAALSVAVAGGFARLLTGDGWVAAVVTAALLPHAVGLATRGRSPAVAMTAWAAALAAYLTWALVPGTTRFALPTVETAREIGNRLDAGLAVLRDQRAPVAARPGVVLLAVVVVFLMAAIADALAFRRWASVGALAPAVTLFIWIAALAPGSSSPALAAVAVVVTGAAFLALQHQVLQTRQRALVGSTGTVPAPRQVAAGVVVAALAAVVATALAPLLPGAGADPLVDLHDEGRGSSTYQTAVPPLVDVADNLRRTEQLELFTVGAGAPQYWRTVALDQYSAEGGGQWTLQAAGDDIERGLDGDVPPGALRQDFRIGALGERWMPAAFDPVAVDRPDTLVVAESQTLVTGADTVSGLRYSVASLTPPADLTDAQRRATAAAPPASMAALTALPDDVPASVRDLARSITAGATNAYDRARLLRDYFRDGSFEYDVDVDLSDTADATVAFLRLKRGFCVQFASTYALMARAVGIPARVAVGFTPGTLDPATGRYSVTNFEAHAWPEVWLAGIGWTNRFEPTPSSTQPGGGDLPGDTAATPIPAPVAPTTPPTAAPEPGAPTPEAPGSGVEPAAPDERAGAPSGSSWPTVLVVALLAAAAVAALLGAIPLWKWRRRAARRARAEPAARIAGAWEEAIDRLGELGRPPPVAETPAEVAGRVDALVGTPAAGALADLADAHTAAQFGAAPVSEAAATGAWDDLAAFTRALDEHLGLRRRLRARLSPVRRRGKAGQRVGVSGGPSGAGT